MVGRKQETEEVVDDSKEKEDKNGKVETRKYLPWKIIYQNIRRLVTKENKEKVEFFEDIGKK